MYKNSSHIDHSHKISLLCWYAGVLSGCLAELNSSHIDDSYTVKAGNPKQNNDPKQRHRRRVRQSGLLVRLRRRAHHTLLPSILLHNVQSLDNKVDEIWAWVAFKRDIRDCNVHCFTETWLTRDMLSESVQPAGFFMHRADRNKRPSGKTKGGGACLMVNETITTYRNSSPSVHLT